MAGRQMSSKVCQVFFAAKYAVMFTPERRSRDIVTSSHPYNFVALIVCTQANPTHDSNVCLGIASTSKSLPIRNPIATPMKARLNASLMTPRASRRRCTNERSKNRTYCIQNPGALRWPTFKSSAREGTRLKTCRSCADISVCTSCSISTSSSSSWMRPSPSASRLSIKVARSWSLNSMPQFSSAVRSSPASRKPSASISARSKLTAQRLTNSAGKPGAILSARS
mmetsp:Transcript_6444/g.21547  ORF Transcript_6444/g.21547 Transcript_6444/m.21547 type:complete len:225 (-) Transcript_6444:281-955(-)